MNVLLIEDTAAFAIPIQQELAASGHTFTRIVGAQRFENNHIVGIRPNPSADPMGDEWDNDNTRLIDINPADFDIVLSDGGLVGPVGDGVKFVEFISALNIPCIAITGGAAGNVRLLEAGAVDGLPKEFVVLALRSGKLNLFSFIRSHASSGTLKSFVIGLREQILANRNTSQKIMLGYPLLDRCA